MGGLVDSNFPKEYISRRCKVTKHLEWKEGFGSTEITAYSGAV